MSLKFWALLGAILLIALVAASEAKKIHHLPLYTNDKIRKYYKSAQVSTEKKKVAHNPYFEPRPRLRSALEKFGVTSNPPPTNLNLTGAIWPTGGFWTYTNVGTPPQPQMTQIDTGSSDLLVPQLNCINCPDTVQYNPAASSTVEVVSCQEVGFQCVACTDSNQCEFNNTYQTCDLADPTGICYQGGPVFKDVFTVGDLSVTVGFGAVAANVGANDTQSWYMPGVWGVAYPAIAGVWNETVINALVAANEIEDVLSLCINNLQGSGVFVLGGYDESLFTGPLQYTPIYQQNWYTINVTDFLVDGVSIGLPWTIYNEPLGSLFDSGTNTIIVPAQAYDIIAATFVNMCAADVPLTGVCGNIPANETLFSGVCYEMDENDIAMFPNFSVAFNQIDTPFNLTGFDYLIEEDGLYCLGIQNSGTSGFTILGNVFQLPYYLVLDRVNSQMGIAPLSNGCTPSQSFPEPDLSKLLRF